MNRPIVNSETSCNPSTADSRAVEDLGMESRATRPARPLRLDRRRLLTGSLAGAGLVGATIALAACSESGEAKPADDKATTAASQLTALFPRDVAYIAAGIPARLIYTVVDAEGVPAMELPDTARFMITFGDKPVGEPVTANAHSDGVPRPYLPFEFTFPQKGVFDVHAEIDGQRLNSTVIAVTPEEVKMPVIGQPLPSAQTPTTTSTLEVDPICTLVPTCPFHEHNLADVIGTGRPIVVLLATPAYCQTTACGPILETLMEQAAALPENAIVIHSEVYKNPKAVENLSEAELAPLPAAFKMAFEPSLFVADSTGTLVARGDIVLDRTEMARMLALAK